MDLEKNIIITGAPGIGKSSISKLLAEWLNFEQVSFGTQMLRISSDKYGIRDRDKLTELPMSEYMGLVSQVASEIGEKKKCIIDCQASVRKGGGFVPVLTPDVLLEMNLFFVCVLRSHASAIQSRRIHDVSRDRGKETESEIGLHQAVNIAIASYNCDVSGIRVLVVENEENNMSGTVVRIIAQLGGIHGPLGFGKNGYQRETEPKG